MRITSTRMTSAAGFRLRNSPALNVTRRSRGARENSFAVGDAKTVDTPEPMPNGGAGTAAFPNQKGPKCQRLTPATTSGLRNAFRQGEAAALKRMKQKAKREAMEAERLSRLTRLK